MAPAGNQASKRKVSHARPGFGAPDPRGAYSAPRPQGHIARVPQSPVLLLPCSPAPLFSCSSVGEKVRHAKLTALPRQNRLVLVTC